MKILHVISKSKSKLISPLYGYIFNFFGNELECETFDCENLKGYKDRVRSYNPDIIHFHDVFSLNQLDSLLDFKASFMALSIYRYDFFNKNIQNILEKYNNKFNVLFSPIAAHDFFRKQISTNVGTFTIKEVLNESNALSKTLRAEIGGDVCRFGIISPLNEKVVEGVHLGLKKILMTGRKISITWMLFNENDSFIKNSPDYKECSHSISVKNIRDINMEDFQGLIIDWENLHKDYYYELIPVIFKSQKYGKIVLLNSNFLLEDIFRDKLNCFILDNLDMSYLSHTLHFLVSFPDIGQTISENAKKYYMKNHLKDLNQRNLLKGYLKAIKYG